MTPHDEVASAERALQSERAAAARFWSSWRPWILVWGALTGIGFVGGIIGGAMCEQFPDAAIVLATGLTLAILLSFWHRFFVAPRGVRIERLEAQLAEAQGRAAVFQREQAAAERRRQGAEEEARRRRARELCKHEWIEHDVLDDVRWGDGGKWSTFLICRHCGESGGQVA